MISLGYLSDFGLGLGGESQIGNASLRSTGCHETKRCMKVQTKMSRFCSPDAEFRNVGFRPSADLVIVCHGFNTDPGFNQHFNKVVAAVVQAVGPN